MRTTGSEDEKKLAAELVVEMHERLDLPENFEGSALILIDKSGGVYVSVCELTPRQLLTIGNDILKLALPRLRQRLDENIQQLEQLEEIRRKLDEQIIEL